jgi:hypothetical protein
VQEQDADAQAILRFMRAEKEKGKTQISRAEIQRGSGLAYNQLVDTLARLEGTTPPTLVRKTKGIASVWELAG